MAREITILKPGKTYRSVANLQRALADIPHDFEGKPVTYLVVWTADGRCYPIFTGEAAFTLALFQRGFICIG